MSFCFFLSLSFQQTKFLWCYCYFFNKSNSTEQDLTMAHNVDRICQKSSKGDKGIISFPNVGIVLERRKLQEKVYCVNFL